MMYLVNVLGKSLSIMCGERRYKGYTQAFASYVVQHHYCKKGADIDYCTKLSEAIDREDANRMVNLLADLLQFDKYGS